MAIQRRESATEKDGGERMDVQHVAEEPQTVGAEADVGLLADRDEPGEPAEQVPDLPESDQVEERHHDARDVVAGPQGHGRQAHDEQDGDPQHVAVQLRRAGDAVLGQAHAVIVRASKP